MVTFTLNSLLPLKINTFTIDEISCGRCGHCKRLAPTWEELGDAYTSLAKVKMGKVDCTIEKDLCKKYEVRFFSLIFRSIQSFSLEYFHAATCCLQVRGYPTLKLFQDGGEPEAYSGARTLDALTGFVKSKVPHDEL